MLRVSVIIPTLNEERTLEAAIDSAWRSGAAEVLVSDGGSVDATLEIARKKSAILVQGESMRARQMNAAARVSTNQALLFLHADTTLPQDGCRLVAEALSSGSSFGGFRIAFTERHPKLRLAAAMINARTSLTRCPWGDQAQFVLKDHFLASGGFREIPLMEDYELAARMKKLGAPKLLPACVETSGCRFLETGVLRTAAINWRVIILYHLGTPPDRLAQIYRSK